MCQKNVIMFTCGHTRKLSITPCNDFGVICSDLKRVLIPQEGGIGIDIPKDKIVWKCAFKCMEGKPSHDPLIELAKENAAQIEADIGLRIEILSTLTTPATTPSIEQGGSKYDRKFFHAASRRADMKLIFPVEKLRKLPIEEEVEEDA